MSYVRCVNCSKRFLVQLKSEEAECPFCKTGYRISWPAENQAKIRGLKEK